MDTSVFVENVRYYCKKQGTTPTVACRESGVGKSLMSEVKNGHLPSVDRIITLASFLSVTTSDLLGETKPAAKTGDGLNQDERELIQISEDLPDDLRANLLCVARGLSALSRQDNGRNPATPAGAPASSSENSGSAG